MTVVKFDAAMLGRACAVLSSRELHAYVTTAAYHAQTEKPVPADFVMRELNMNMRSFPQLRDRLIARGLLYTPTGDGRLLVPAELDNNNVRWMDDSDLEPQPLALRA